MSQKKSEYLRASKQRTVKAKFQQPDSDKPRLVPKTPNQKLMLTALRQPNSVVITTGPAGTGKTYIASIEAALRLKSGAVHKIIITRPTVPISKSIGYLPGTAREKLEPWAQPVLAYLRTILGAPSLETHLKHENIEIVPFEVVRGRTWTNTFVILDEAQNATYDEVKAFVTRIGENCTVVINGDISQTDLKGTNGLKTLLELAARDRTLAEFVTSVEFTVEDIQRSGVCRAFVIAYTRYESLYKESS